MSSFLGEERIFRAQVADLLDRVSLWDTQQLLSTEGRSHRKKEYQLKPAHTCV